MEIITGALVSLIVETVKRYTGSTEWVTLGVLAVVSLAGAGIYVALKDSSYWPTFYAILVQAAAFYTIIVQRFKSQA